jgi:hypothetical protein
MEVVPAEQLRGAVEERDRLREIIARASRLAEQERAGMVQQVLSEGATTLSHDHEGTT